MHFLISRLPLLSALIVVFLLQLGTAFAQDNRFLVAKDFLVNFTWEDAGNGFFVKGTTTVSFYMENVTDSGIWVFESQSQKQTFHVNHPIVRDCSRIGFSGFPLYPRDTPFDDAIAKRIAVYIPEGTGLFATVTLDECKFAGEESFFRGNIKNGVISGNITVIKGRRVLTRPISGRF